MLNKTEKLEECKKRNVCSAFSFYFSINNELVSVTVSVLLFFLVPFEHGNDVGPCCVSECGQVEMDNHKRAEEYPEEDMDSIENLNTDRINNEREQFRIPQKEAGDNLKRNEQNHDHEI